MSGPLANTRHERFAQALAKGMSQVDAYEEAGYKPSRSAATRLAADVNIRERLAELQGRVAERTEITVAGITARLMRLADLSEQTGSKKDPNGRVIETSPKHLAVTRNALMDAAKLNGLVVEKHDLRSSDGSMTPREPTYKLVK